MLDVILDTNILLLPHTRRIDIFAEIRRLLDDQYEIKVPQAVVDELAFIKGGGRDGIAASVGLKLIESKGLSIIPSKGDADDFIVEYCEKRPSVVATNDGGLKRRLLDAGVRVIFMRGKSHLCMI